MLISTAHNDKLLDQSWIMRRSENKTYYLKYQFIQDGQEYIILITDLCLTWFEHGIFERIQQTAEQEQGIELKTIEAAHTFLKKIEAAFEQSASRAKITRTDDHIKIHLSVLQDKKQQANWLSDLSWTFDCQLLDQVSEIQGQLSGPEVIFQHFIIPSQTIVNYFTENVVDELPERLKLVHTASMFTSNSLDYISTLFRGKNKVALQQQQLTSAFPNLVPENDQSLFQEEELNAQMKKKEEEQERKRIIQEYNKKQQDQLTNPSLIKKKKLKRI